MHALFVIVAVLAGLPKALGPVRAVDGKSVRLAQYAAGRPLVVVVMKGGWCPVCVGQLGRLSAQRARLESLGAAAVGLNADAIANNRLLKQKIPGLDIFSDPSGRVFRALNLWPADLSHPLPGLVFLDRCGDVDSVYMGRAPGAPADQFILNKLRRLRTKVGTCQQLI